MHVKTFKGSDIQAALAKVKAELGAPEEYLAVAPIIVGYADGDTPPRERNAPEVAYWR